MIIVKTKLKKIPEKCNKCPFYFYHSYDYGRVVEKACLITRTAIEMEYSEKKKNYCNVKPKNCPLVEVEE